MAEQPQLGARRYIETEPQYPFHSIYVLTVCVPASELSPSSPAGMHFFLLVAVRSSVLCMLVVPLLWRHRVNRECGRGSTASGLFIPAHQRA